MEPKICIAMGGGAARGLAHLGVLKVFEEGGVPIDMIAGTSLGALIGGCYAFRPDAAYWTTSIDQYLRSFRSRKTRLEFVRRLEAPDPDNHGFFSDMANLIRKGYFWGITATKPAFISEREYEDFIYPLIPDVTIESLKIPFACVATDIRNGNRTIYRDGPLRLAVSASCALPGIFPPVADGARLLVDGGWVERVPVHCAREMGADIVIAVDVSSEVGTFENHRYGLDVVMRADAVTRIYLNELQVRDADIVLHPAVGGTHWADFSNPAELVGQGETTAREKVEKIKIIIEQARASGIPQKSLVDRIKDIRDRIRERVTGAK
jgi:NTE family protein